MKLQKMMIKQAGDRYDKRFLIIFIVMLLLENRKFNPKGKAFIFFLLFIASGIPWWISSYSQYLNNSIFSILSTILCAAGAGCLAYYTAYKKREIILVSMAAHQAAFLIKVLIDCIPDGSNHNLLPFEMLVFLVVDGIAFSIISMIIKLSKPKEFR
ncbi:MAG: hypothetical protein ABI581_01030 [Sediminibacterium sp.]